MSVTPKLCADFTHGQIKTQAGLFRVWGQEYLTKHSLCIKCGEDENIKKVPGIL